MEDYIVEIMPICLSAVGGAMLIISLYSLMGKADILTKYEQKHFQKDFWKTLSRFESIVGIFYSFWFFFTASVILFGETERIPFILGILVSLFIVYFAIYAILWVKKRKQ